MSQATKAAIVQTKNVYIRSGDMQLEGDWSIAEGAQGVVLFAHGSGSSRHSPRNQFVARTIREAGVGTLLFDLLTKEEEAVDMLFFSSRRRHTMFDCDWSSDVCSSDWHHRRGGHPDVAPGEALRLLLRRRDRLEPAERQRLPHRVQVSRVPFLPAVRAGFGEDA